MGIILFGMFLTILGLAKVYRGRVDFKGLYVTTTAYRKWALCMWTGMWVMWLGFVWVGVAFFSQ